MLSCAERPRTCSSMPPACSRPEWCEPDDTAQGAESPSEG
ncbi:histidine kinase [Burkholderia cenocepacia]|nr:histidine kinase [Burkholderia cenocepacia]